MTDSTDARPAPLPGNIDKRGMRALVGKFGRGIPTLALRPLRRAGTVSSSLEGGDEYVV
jgi:hypothetical protein